MDALVKAALERVTEAIEAIGLKAVDPETDIARAVHAVDALKSALKTLKPQPTSMYDQLKKNPETFAEYLRVSQSR